jgi:hypothetical protein
MDLQKIKSIGTRLDVLADIRKHPSGRKCNFLVYLGPGGVCSIR